MPMDVREVVDDLYRKESRRILATLIRLVGDFELAEDALQEAFAVAAQRWPNDGIPENPRAWLISTGRFKAIDAIRRRVRLNESMVELAKTIDESTNMYLADPDAVEDDTLRLIFTCCHPAISLEAQVALTLREVCGLTTEEISRAFLTTVTTMAQRVVRAKQKIRDAGIPYRVPSRTELPERLDAVLRVVYLVFSEGYSSSSGVSLTRADLSSEAIRLGRIILDLCPSAEVEGLLALMLIQESRRSARTSSSGDLILLDQQDRSRWDREMINEGVTLVQRALANGRGGPYAVQAAIAAVHAEAPSPAETDWAEIADLYELLRQLTPSPVVDLNRAVAIAMRDGEEAGLQALDEIADSGALDEFHLLHSARADLLRRLGKVPEARQAYERALHLAKQEPERRFLAARLENL